MTAAGAAPRRRGALVPEMELRDLRDGTSTHALLHKYDMCTRTTVARDFGLGRVAGEFVQVRFMLVCNSFANPALRDLRTVPQNGGLPAAG